MAYSHNQWSIHTIRYSVYWLLSYSHAGTVYWFMAYSDNQDWYSVLAFDLFT